MWNHIYTNIFLHVSAFRLTDSLIHKIRIRKPVQLAEEKDISRHLKRELIKKYWRRKKRKKRTLRELPNLYPTINNIMRRSNLQQDLWINKLETCFKWSVQLWNDWTNHIGSQNQTISLIPYKNIKTSHWLLKALLIRIYVPRNWNH